MLHSVTHNTFSKKFSDYFLDWISFSLSLLDLAVVFVLRSVIFNRVYAEPLGSVEPKGSVSICQGFRCWSVKK